MADVKQILVVDDHFEMLELLRSMLELSGHDYEVLAVPSAEEAMLELLRMKFDLLITDVRLPGMSGFDFVRRVRRRQPDLPVIMITAYSSAQGQKEADELNVYRYFAKPLDTDNVLTAVHTALYGESVEPDNLLPPPPAGFRLPDNVQKRLQSLQLDTGATGLVLSTIQGQVLLELGDNSRLDVARIVAKIAENVANSLVLAGLLGEINPFTIQYHTGEATELYNANVGRDYFVTLLFGMESRRGRIGTIWVFAQRAIRDLVNYLPPLADLESGGGANTPLLSQSKPAESVLSPVKPEAATAVPGIPEPTFDAPPEPTEADMADLLSALNLDEQPVETINLDSFWDEAVVQSDEAPNPGNTISFAEAASLVEGLAAGEPLVEQKPVLPAAEVTEVEPEPVEVDMDGLLAALNLSEAETAVDLDEFWDDAVNDSDTSGSIRGLSFEEATKRGLIDMDEKE